MLWRMLKKDLMHRKSINVILFLFITIATIFLASSVNNIIVVSSSVDNYLDYANLSDITIITSSTKEHAQIEQWLKKEAPGVQDFGYQKMLQVEKTHIHKEDKTALKAEGIRIFLSDTKGIYCKVYDQNGDAFDLKEHEIALSTFIMKENNIQVGDTLTIQVGNVSNEYTVAYMVKDAAFGNEMGGMTRIFMNEREYEAMLKEDAQQIYGIYFVNAASSSAFTSAQNNCNFTSVMMTTTRSMYAMMYTFDLVVAGLLIFIGICLILIAMLVLRFTLIFTMEEEYREIGIMKAIGLRNTAIRKLYLVKYFVLVVCGAILGLVVSVPISGLMVEGVSVNMIMEKSDVNFLVNFLCTLIIICLVLLFCMNCTRKLHHISAIAAIQSGHNGESWTRTSAIALSKRSHMPLIVYLGVNDILTHLRRYALLLVTFCISFLLITIPLNTIHTMNSKEMAYKFALDADSTIFVNKIEGRDRPGYTTADELKTGMQRVKKELKKLGYDAQLYSSVIYFLTFKQKESGAYSKIMTIQIQGHHDQFLEYDEGSAPIMENEVAFSRQVMEEYGWHIGDRVEMIVNDTTYDMVITATYSDYMQLGVSARLNPKLAIDIPMFEYWNINVRMDTTMQSEEIKQQLQTQLPAYEWSTAQEIVDQNVGGIQGILKAMLLPMTGMLCAVIMFIAFLMEKLFIVREKGEIAMMKSIGFRNKTIRLWQLLRMILVALVSMTAAIPLSMLSNRFVLRPIFAIMGADVAIQVDPVQVYLLYPGILLIGIVCATVFATGSIRHIHIREMNNLE